MTFWDRTPCWQPRVVVGAAVLVAGAVTLALAGHAHYAIQRWLFWRLVGYWAACSFWAFACLSGGRWLLGLLGLMEMSFLDRLAVAFASGVVLFFLGMFAAGILAVMTPGFAVLWPCVLAALDGRRTLLVLRRSSAALFRRPHLGWGELAATCFGLAGLGMVYFTILTPDNLGFDARWYHLAIAEHFAAGRRIGRFEEGWFLGAYPHLASVIYAWAFLLPKTDLFDRVLLASHLELTLFMATLACVGLMVRRLAGAAPRGAWAAVFLFPSVFLYDGGLFGAADHVLAFFAIPAYLCLDHAMKRPSIRRCAPLAIVLSGALLTKYQAVLFLFPIAVALGVAIALRRLRGFSRGLELGGPAVAVITGLLVTAPHWLANWIWYSDPLFPLLHDYLPSRPLTSQAVGRLDVFLGTDLWRPHGGLWQKISDTSRALVTFSFEPHDWATYHGSVPIFGSFRVPKRGSPFLLGQINVVANSTRSPAPTTDYVRVRTQPQQWAGCLRHIPKLGRLEHGLSNLTYDPLTRYLQSVSDPGGETVTYGHDKSLLTSVAWSGLLNGSVLPLFDKNFRLASTSLNTAGQNKVIFDYDLDGVLRPLGLAVDSASSRSTCSNRRTTSGEACSSVTSYLQSVSDPGGEGWDDGSQ